MANIITSKTRRGNWRQGKKAEVKVELAENKRRSEEGTRRSLSKIREETIKNVENDVT